MYTVTLMLIEGNTIDISVEAPNRHSAEYRAYLMVGKDIVDYAIDVKKEK